MLPVNLNLTGKRAIYQGDSYVLTLGLSLSEGAPLDLNSATLRMQIRSDRGDALVLDASPYLSVVDPASGAIKLELPPEATAALPVEGGCVTHYVYDVEVTLGDGSRDTWLRGMVAVVPEVTR